MMNDENAMNIWEHLFMTGEFKERKSLLSGLTLEQVTRCADGASHSIYDELWHTVRWQRITLELDKPVRDALVRDVPNYSIAPPEDEQQWHDLVRQFLEGARDAAELGQMPDRLALEVEPGFTIADELHSLAVHNAYHFGKIVALRQRMGAWPPRTKEEA